MERESTEVRIKQKLEKKEETLLEKIKRSPDKRHTEHMKALLKHFDNHRCLSQSQEGKCM